MQASPDDREVTHRQGIYLIRCVRINEDHEPEQWYWHLFRHEVRINGGLNNCIEEAMFAAGVNWRRDNGAWARVGGERV